MFKLAPLPLLAALLCAASQAAAQDQGPVQLAQLTIEQRVVIRIPIVPTERTNQRGAMLEKQAQTQDDDLREVKGPKCLKLEKLRGALIKLDSDIVLITDKGERFRTHFEKNCRAAAFYAGFYITPTKDGAICSGRDVLHARNGSTCDIERFAKLVPED